MAIFLVLLGCSLFCMGVGLWVGYFLGRTSTLEWLKELTGVRIDHHGRVLRPEYVNVAADGRILKFGEVVAYDPQRRDAGPHG